MTSLIDVIFLLLLFFMLSSTFSRFAEVELASARGGGSGTSDSKPVFLQLGEDSLQLNGQAVTLDALAPALQEAKQAQDKLPVLVSLRAEVTAQRLTDLLVALRGMDGMAVTVLEAS